MLVSPTQVDQANTHNLLFGVTLPHLDMCVSAVSSPPHWHKMLFRRTRLTGRTTHCRRRRSSSSSSSSRRSSCVVSTFNMLKTQLEINSSKLDFIYNACGITKLSQIGDQWRWWNTGMHMKNSKTRRLKVFCVAEAKRHLSMSKRVSRSLTMLMNSASTSWPS